MFKTKGLILQSQASYKTIHSPEKEMLNHSEHSWFCLLSNVYKDMMLPSLLLILEFFSVSQNYMFSITLIYNNVF